MRARASFTIEASYVLGVFCMAFVTMILFAYRLHGRVIAEYVTHYALEKAGHSEKIYEEEDVEEILQEAQGRIRAVGILQGSSLELEKNWSTAEASVRTYAGEQSFKSGIYNPENFMRMITVLERIGENMQEQDEEGSERRGGA